VVVIVIEPPPNSILVMDNVPYHSRQLTKIPNSSSHKTDIQDFLREHDLYFEDNYKNNELIEVLRTIKFEKNYVVDYTGSIRTGGPK
jgi:hypothetical protein